MPRNDSLDQAAAVIASGYLKRWLEGALYDRLDQTPLMQSVHELPEGARYGLEAALNLMNAIFDNQLVADTPTKRLIKETILDAAPELSKRVINGKDKTRHVPWATALLDLDNEELASLLSWMSTCTAQERSQIAHFFRYQTPEALKRLAGLSPDQRMQFITVIAGTGASGTNTSLAKQIRRIREQLKKGGST